MVPALEKALLTVGKGPIPIAFETRDDSVDDIFHCCVLKIEAFNAVLRCMAYQLLSRARGMPWACT